MSTGGKQTSTPSQAGAADATCVRTESSSAQVARSTEKDANTASRSSHRSERESRMHVLEFLSTACFILIAILWAVDHA